MHSIILTAVNGKCADPIVAKRGCLLLSTECSHSRLKCFRLSAYIYRHTLLLISHRRLAHHINDLLFLQSAMRRRCRSRMQHIHEERNRMPCRVSCSAHRCCLSSEPHRANAGGYHPGSERPPSAYTILPNAQPSAAVGASSSSTKSLSDNVRYSAPYSAGSKVATQVL